jgi:hypothetical protein
MLAKDEGNLSAHLHIRHMYDIASPSSKTTHTTLQCILLIVLSILSDTYKINKRCTVMLPLLWHHTME